MKDKAVRKKVDFIIDQIILKRIELKFSQQKLAKKANINRATISLIENKKRIPTIFTLLKIYKALDLCLDKVIIKYNTLPGRLK